MVLGGAFVLGVLGDGGQPQRHSGPASCPTGRKEKYVSSSNTKKNRLPSLQNRLSWSLPSEADSKVGWASRYKPFRQVVLGVGWVEITVLGTFLRLVTLKGGKQKQW